MFIITPVSLFFAFSTFLSLLVALISWQKRRISGAIYLFQIMLLLTLWSLVNFFESIATSVSLKVFYSKLEYLFGSFVPLLYLGFVFFYTGRIHWLKSKVYNAAFAIPTLLFLLAFTNEYHHLIWTGFSEINPTTNLIEYHHGIGFYIGWIGYSYICLLVATLMLLEFISTQKQAFRRQGILLLFAMAFPWMASLFYMFNINIIPGLNITPASFSLTGLVFLASIVSSSFIDMVPVARDLIVQELRDGILAVDHRNRIVFVNKVASNFMLVEKNRFIGHSLEMVPFKNRGLKESLLSSEPGARQVFYCDEQLICYEINCYGLKDYPGSRVYLVRDITEQKRAENEIRQINEKLSQLNAEKDRLFSIIGHDLRNLFSVIMGYSELLQMAVEEEDYDQKVMEVNTRNIIEATERALALLENLLMWARVEGGRMLLSIHKLDLQRIVDEVVVEMMLKAKQKQISLQSEIEASIIVESDENMLLIIVRNLLSNALKFTHRGGSIRIYAKKETKNDFIQLVVEDSGIGIPKVMLENIFKIDSESGRSGTENEKSTGFGLILVKELVGLIGGEIFIESEEGKGTRVIVNLPCSRPTGVS